jgi:hypothetical protein
MEVTEVLALSWQPSQSSRRGRRHEKGIDVIGSPLRTGHHADWRHVSRELISEGDPRKSLGSIFSLVLFIKGNQYKISKTKLSISMIEVTPATESTNASLASW